MTHSPGKTLIPFTVLVAALLCFGTTLSLRGSAANNACPFCSAIALTFAEQINERDVVVIAKLIETPEPPSVDDEDFPDGKFEIVTVVKGDTVLRSGMTFYTQLVGVYPLGQKFLVMGQGVPDVAWTTPIKVSDRTVDYLAKITELPEKGPERLVFFQDYFEDQESILAFDAYDEFAAAPYKDLIAMKDSMRRDQLLEFIESPKTTVDRRRLYFTMLGVCGKPEDVATLEGFLKSGSRKQRAGLDALVGCYLTLAGEDGLKLIEKQFLTNPDADYVDISQVVDALRFHATETDVIKLSSIVPVIRVLLDHPDHADIVIEDLARWKDWSVMDKLVDMFKKAKTDGNWQRVPIITYLRACPKPEAAQYIEQLRKIDPESVKRADFYLGIGDLSDDWNDAAPKIDSDESSDADAVPQSSPELSSDIITDGNVAKASFTPPLPAATAAVGDAVPTNLIEPVQPELSPASLLDSAPVQVALNSRVSASQRTPRQAPASYGLLAKIILIPLAASFFVLGLMWSVVNGWFERLIF